jgi:hypothetical protein
MPEPFARVVPCTLAVDIAKSSLNRIGRWAVRGQMEQREAGMGRQPLLHLRRVVNLRVVGHDGELRERRGYPLT